MPQSWRHGSPLVLHHAPGVEVLQRLRVTLT
ncbi:hypothetical protein SMALA_4797 [Streptomyces malaysiensis subsp. malaysiensis]|nr:hypothetical protein SMALA_4797 [Streptomyces malaysiensis]